MATSTPGSHEIRIEEEQRGTGATLVYRMALYTIDSQIDVVDGQIMKFLLGFRIAGLADTSMALSAIGVSKWMLHFGRFLEIARQPHERVAGGEQFHARPA